MDAMAPKAMRNFGSSTKWLSAVIFALAAPGCSEVETFEDVGNVVLVPDASFDEEEVEFIADQMIHGKARSGVFASACDEVDASCEIELDGEAIVVTAVFERQRPAGRCDLKEASRTMEAECVSAPVPAGTYVLHYGSESAELVIPSRSPPLQVGPDVESH